MKKCTTLVDIAQAADVSVMTDSRAINNKPGIRSVQQEKNLRQADEMVFYPDLVAIGAMQVCLESRRYMLDDVAITGADDIPLATVIRPQLTSLHVNLVHISRLAMGAV